jgi:hypothetical protein
MAERLDTIVFLEVRFIIRRERAAAIRIKKDIMICILYLFKEAGMVPNSMTDLISPT